MNSQFVSIDIETLGLSTNAPIIEFGAVQADWLTGEIQDTFHTYVVHKSYNNCDPYAMSMHPTILRRIALGEKGYYYTRVDDLARCFNQWLPNDYQYANKSLVVAGKNVASFDLPRLSAQCKNWDTYIKTHRRVLDPAMLFWNPAEDEVPPSSDECLKRAGIAGETQHTALEDALDVAQMIFVAVGRRVNPCKLIEVQNV